MPVYTERSAGTYRARYLGCVDKLVTDRETNEEKSVWLWRFQELTDPATTGELAKFTGTSMQSPNSNAYKMAAGILGHKPQPGDDTEKHVGDVYDIQYNLNQAGNLTIVGVVRVKEEKASKVKDEPAASPEKGEAEALPDELPF